jgi:hypothetical protein
MTASTTNYPLTTTLNRIYSQTCLRHNSKEFWRRTLEALGKTQADDDLITFLELADKVESCGLQFFAFDLLLCLKSTPEYSNHWRRFAVWCARREIQPTDACSLQILNVAEQYAEGTASLANLATAWEIAENAYDELVDGCTRAEIARTEAVWATTRPAAWKAAAMAFKAAASAEAAQEGAVALTTAWTSAYAAAQRRLIAAFRQLVTDGTLPPHIITIADTSEA